MCLPLVLDKPIAQYQGPAAYLIPGTIPYKNNPIPYKNNPIPYKNNTIPYKNNTKEELTSSPFNILMSSVSFNCSCRSFNSPSIWWYYKKTIAVIKSINQLIKVIINNYTIIQYGKYRTLLLRFYFWDYWCLSFL